VNSRRTIVSASILTAAAALTPVAQADTVNMVFSGTGKGSNIAVEFFGAAPKTVFAGQLQHTITAGTGQGTGLIGSHRSFCADFQQNVATSSSIFDIVATQDLDVRGTPMGPSTASAIESIFSVHGAAASAANASKDFATAFQIAVWDILYDFNANQPGNGIGLGTGNIKFTATNGGPLSSGIVTSYNQIISAIGSGAAAGFVYALEQAAKQDQLLYTSTPVPSPGAAALAILGIATMAPRRRRNAST